MPVRLRITFLFTGLAMLILLVVCCSIYFFSYEVRKGNIERRLKNRAITTARLLSQKETFDSRVVQKIDSLTTIALKNKVVQAYNYENEKIYNYSDVVGDSLDISKDMLDEARINGSKFFILGDKEVVAYHYSDDFTRIVVISAAEDEDGKNALASLKNILLLSFFFGSFFVLLTGFFFSTKLLQPIKKITADVEEISAQNLARRIKKGSSNDEWNNLADTLNRLLNRLQEGFEFQKRFISNASHELSTPLTSISSQLEVTLQKDRSPENYRQVMESVYQDVKHMSTLTQTLLEFAKAAGASEGLDMNVIRMDEIILQLPSEIVRINKAYRVSLEFDELPVDEEKLLVFGNEVLLLMAIRNIVVNGCKYSIDHHCSVLLKTKDELLMVSIRDNGPGIPANEIQHIFQPFYRVRQHSGTEGFGLGLPLALQIISMHKGNIEVFSRSEKGSEFIISLPVASPKMK